MPAFPFLSICFAFTYLYLSRYRYKEKYAWTLAHVNMKYCKE